MDGVIIAFENIYSELVVLRTFSVILPRIGLSKTLGEVETETVDLVLLKEIFQALLDMKLDKFVSMVHVTVDIVRVLWHLVEPRVVDRCTAMTEIHLHKRAVVGEMIIYHIEEYSYPSPVAFVDKVLIVLACAVVLVQSEVMVRVISPAVA